MSDNEQEFLDTLPALHAPVSEVLAWGPTQFLGTWRMFLTFCNAFKE